MGSTVGATGGIYAIRRNLFEPIPPNILIDDVSIPTFYIAFRFVGAAGDVVSVCPPTSSCAGTFTRKASNRLPPILLVQMKY